MGTYCLNWLVAISKSSHCRMNSNAWSLVIVR
jgi:hypothetical protein